jgi:hypothetical protein
MTAVTGAVVSTAGRLYQRMKITTPNNAIARTMAPAITQIFLIEENQPEVFKRSTFFYLRLLPEMDRLISQLSRAVLPDTVSPTSPRFYLIIFPKTNDSKDLIRENRSRITPISSGNKMKWDWNLVK